MCPCNVFRWKRPFKERAAAVLFLSHITRAGKGREGHCAATAQVQIRMAAAAAAAAKTIGSMGNHKSVVVMANKTFALGRRFRILVHT